MSALNFIQPKTADNLDKYIAFVNSVPALSQDKEQELFLRYQQYNDIEAVKQIILAHMRHVVAIAKGFSGYGLPIGDLIQEGSVGLMKAVKKFSLEHNVRLITFAIYWIKSEIHEYIIKNWKIVKIATTKAQRKLFFNLRSMKSKLGWASDAEKVNIAKKLEIDPSEIDHMEARISSSDESFETPANEYSLAPSDYLTASNNTDKIEQLEALIKNLPKLDKVSQTIIQQRYFGASKVTLADIAKEMNLSKERVRQLEKIAINKLRNLLN